MKRPLVLAYPSAAPVVPGLVDGLGNVLVAAGAEPQIWSPPGPGPHRIRRRHYRMGLPRLGPDRRWLRGLAWLVTYPLIQFEMALIVLRARRTCDGVVLFLGCHFLLPALAARIVGLPILYLPGGSPHQVTTGPGRRALLQLLFTGVHRLSSLVALESSLELPRVNDSKVVVGALRGSEPGSGRSTACSRNGFLFLSRLEDQKGLREFLDVVPLAPDGTRFIVAGSGRLEDEARRMAQAHSAIEFLGWVDEPEKIRLLRSVQALVLPSKGGDGVPTVLMEAFHCGTPVIATAVGGIGEYLRDDETGFVLPEPTATCIADAMGRLLATPNLGRISANARNVAQTAFSMDAAAKRFRGLLARPHLAHVPRVVRPGRRHLSTAATLTNAAAGLAAIALAVHAMDPRAEWIIPLLCLGLALDGVDGQLARRFGSIRLGPWLDAAADSVTFVALPSVLLLLDGAAPAAAAFAAAGAVRLWMFARAPSQPTFRGLPASVGGILVVLLVQLELPPGVRGTAAAILALLMLSPLTYPKIHARQVRLLGAFVGLIVAHAAIVVLAPPWRAMAIQSALVVTLAVLAGAPVFAWASRRRAARATLPASTASSSKT